LAKRQPKKYFRKIIENPLSAVIDMPQNYIPQFQIQSIGIKDLMIKRPKQLSAAKAAQFPRWVAFFNSTQMLDYFVLQDIYTNTVAGRIVDFISWLTVGKGPKPVLKLKNPEQFGDKKSQMKEIEKGKDITQRLLEIDRKISDTDDESLQYEHSISEKFSGLLKNTLTFGKAANIRIVKNKRYFLIPLHPRDMMYNIVSKEWKLEAIHTMLDSAPYALSQLIFAEYNAENPQYHNLFNGFPFIQRMIDSARTLRRLKGIDFQLIAKKRWSGSALIAIKKRTDNQSDATVLMNKLSNGEIYASEEDDPEHAYKIHEIPLKAESADLIELAKYLTNDCISQAGIPTSLFFDEAAANYATMEEKMKFFKAVIDNEWRPWYGQILGKQWYQRNFVDEFGSNKEYMKKYYIDCEFVDIDFNSMQSKITILTMLNKIYPIKTEAAGEVLGIENFENMIDPEGQAIQTEEMTLTDENGKKSKLERDVPKEKQKPEP